MLSLEGRSALVTGGGRGIGRAVSLLFARLGASVAVNYRHDATAAERTVAELEKTRARAVAIQADMSRPEQAERAVAETVSALGALDVLVVNHGIWKRAPIDEMAPHQWEEMLSVNLSGALAVCHHASREMLAKGSGSIVLIASSAGQRGEANYAHYAASKGALIALTKSLATELGPRGVRVNAVAPGWVVTEMTRSELEGSAAQAAAAIPTGGPATPEQIAGPVAFLASEMASFVYGEVLSVNGGAVTGA